MYKKKSVTFSRKQHSQKYKTHLKNFCFVFLSSGHFFNPRGSAVLRLTHSHIHLHSGTTHTHRYGDRTGFRKCLILLCPVTKKESYW